MNRGRSRSCSPQQGFEVEPCCPTCFREARSLSPEIQARCANSITLSSAGQSTAQLVRPPVASPLVPLSFVVPTPVSTPSSWDSRLPTAPCRGLVSTSTPLVGASALHSSLSEPLSAPPTIAPAGQQGFWMWVEDDEDDEPEAPPPQAVKPLYTAQAWTNAGQPPAAVPWGNTCLEHAMGQILQLQTPVLSMPSHAAGYHSDNTAVPVGLAATHEQRGRVQESWQTSANAARAPSPHMTPAPPLNPSPQGHTDHPRAPSPQPFLAAVPRNPSPCGRTTHHPIITANVQSFRQASPSPSRAVSPLGLHPYSAAYEQRGRGVQQIVRQSSRSPLRAESPPWLLQAQAGSRVHTTMEGALSELRQRSQSPSRASSPSGFNASPTSYEHRGRVVQGARQSTPSPPRAHSPPPAYVARLPSPAPDNVRDRRHSEPSQCSRAASPPPFRPVPCERPVSPHSWHPTTCWENAMVVEKGPHTHTGAPQMEPHGGAQEFSRASTVAGPTGLISRDDFHRLQGGGTLTRGRPCVGSNSLSSMSAAPTINVSMRAQHSVDMEEPQFHGRSPIGYLEAVPEAPEEQASPPPTQPQQLSNPKYSPKTQEEHENVQRIVQRIHAQEALQHTLNITSPPPDLSVLSVNSHVSVGSHAAPSPSVNGQAVSPAGQTSPIQLAPVSPWRFSSQQTSIPRRRVDDGSNLSSPRMAGDPDRAYPTGPHSPSQMEAHFAPSLHNHAQPGSPVGVIDRTFSTGSYSAEPHFPPSQFPTQHLSEENDAHMHLSSQFPTQPPTPSHFPTQPPTPYQNTPAQQASLVTPPPINANNVSNVSYYPLDVTVVGSGASMKGASVSPAFPSNTNHSDSRLPSDAWSCRSDTDVVTSRVVSDPNVRPGVGDIGAFSSGDWKLDGRTSSGIMVVEHGDANAHGVGKPPGGSGKPPPPVGFGQPPGGNGGAPAFDIGAWGAHEWSQPPGGSGTFSVANSSGNNMEAHPRSPVHSHQMQPGSMENSPWQASAGFQFYHGEAPFPQTAPPTNLNLMPPTAGTFLTAPPTAPPTGACLTAPPTAPPTGASCLTAPPTAPPTGLELSPAVAPHSADGFPCYPVSVGPCSSLGTLTASASYCSTQGVLDAGGHPNSLPGSSTVLAGGSFSPPHAPRRPTSSRPIDVEVQHTGPCFTTVGMIGDIGAWSTNDWSSAGPSARSLERGL